MTGSNDKSTQRFFNPSTASYKSPLMIPAHVCNVSDSVSDPIISALSVSQLKNHSNPLQSILSQAFEMAIPSDCIDSASLLSSIICFHEASRSFIQSPKPPKRFFICSNIESSHTGFTSNTGLCPAPEPLAPEPPEPPEPLPPPPPPDTSFSGLISSMPRMVFLYSSAAAVAPLVASPTSPIPSAKPPATSDASLPIAAVPAYDQSICCISIPKNFAICRTASPIRLTIAVMTGITVWSRGRNSEPIACARDLNSCFTARIAPSAVFISWAYCPITPWLAAWSTMV